MSSFRQSRGRIFFDTLCAFGMSASCALAWMQTYATALLGAAGIAGLYGLVRFTEIFRRPAAVDETVEAELTTVEPVITAVETDPPEKIALRQPTPELPEEVVAALTRKPKRKAKRPAKSAPSIEQLSASESEEADPPTTVDEPAAEPGYSAPIAPLFEPEPFVRQHQRAAFGRKFGVR